MKGVTLGERERERGWEREREREGEREDNTLLHRDKDLSTSRLFCKSVPDDKHSNTQYMKSERERERERGGGCHRGELELDFFSPPKL